MYNIRSVYFFQNTLKVTKKKKKTITFLIAREKSSLTKIGPVLNLYPWNLWSSLFYTQFYNHKITT